MSKKAELLGKYADKEVTPFWQYDVFHTGDGDEQGDEIFMGQTWDLMAGSDVRVLVGRRTSQAEAIRMLEKICKSMAESFPKEKYVMNQGKVWEDNEHKDSDLPF